ncbi:hypothetical protein B0H34DRAFT_785387 [Crassisporium funariophilum]|nr:hypothetical protein B0H34DRAFT_785387 [Crassisporium funariophilum]
MKLSIAAVVAGAALAQVNAVPLRVIVVSSNIQPVQEGPSGMRFGHGVPMPDVAKMVAVPRPMEGMKRPCAGRSGRYRQKAVEISNAFRKALGWPLIEADPNPHHQGHNGGGMFKILPFVGTAPTFIEVKGPAAGGFWDGKTKGGDRVVIHPVENMPHPHHRPHHHHHNLSHSHGHTSFLTRIHYSLMNLGRWEGRAVAFVLGCGIGVLLRMFWVLTVVAYRAMKGRRDEDEVEYSQITIIEDFEDAEEIHSPPPNYTYPVDEKADIKVDAPKAYTTNEELK